MDATRRIFLKAAAGAAATPALALPQRPKLLVLLIAGQFRTDYLDSHRDLFGAGGFRRLMETGSFFPDCRIESTTFTASGLATIATGAYPNVHGIVADRWYDKGVVHEAAPGDLAAATLTAGRSFTIGFDRSSAGFLGTGSVLTPEPPDTAQRWAWQALGSKSAPPMRTITRDPAKPAEFSKLWKASPLGSAAQFALARDVLERQHLGRAESVDCLSIVLDSLQDLGYESGGNSPLMFDLVSHLDRQLESFLGFLDASIGAGGYSIVFTACHGAPDAAGRVIRGQQIAAALGNTLEAYLYPFLYLRGNARRADRLAAAETVQRAGLIDAWYTADGDCSHSGQFRRRLENSFYRGRSGDIIVAYAPGAVEYYGDGRGISYGSIYNYDARVPLMFRGPQFRAQVFDEPVESIDIAPTLARVLGLPVPWSSTGRVLGQTFR